MRPPVTYPETPGVLTTAPKAPVLAKPGYWTTERRVARLQRPIPFASWFDVIRHHAAKSPDRMSFTFLPDFRTEAARLTCADVETRMLAIAARLQHLEATGERALMLLDNSPEYLTAFLGCVAAGTVGVTLHPPTKRKHFERIAHVAKDCGASFILSTTPIYERFHDAIKAVPELSDLTWVLVDEVSDAESASWEEWSPPANAVAYLQYTSGSTGSPRGVVVTNEDLIVQAELLEKSVAFSTSDRMLSWLPIFHDMGLIYGALQPLYTGFPLYLSTPLAAVKYPDRWMKGFSTYRCTVSAAPNFMYELVNQAVRDDDLEGVDLSSIRMMLCAAEPIRSKTLRTFTEKLAPYGLHPRAVHPGYGLAEATLGVSVRNLRGDTVFRDVSANALKNGQVMPPEGDEETLTIVGSGQPFREVRFFIVDGETGEELPPNTIGEIWCDTPGMPHGYWEKPEKSAVTFGGTLANVEPPLLRTGDLGFLDENGEISITGRKKELIIINGKNHFPSDIEQTVEEASSLVRANFCAAFSVDAADGELLVIVAELDPRAAENADLTETARTIRREVASTHELRAHEIVFLAPGQLPKTTSGKIQRTEARQRWLDNAFDVLARG